MIFHVGLLGIVQSSLPIKLQKFLDSFAVLIHGLTRFLASIGIGQLLGTTSNSGHRGVAGKRAAHNQLLIGFIKASIVPRGNRVNSWLSSSPFYLLDALNEL